jgi:hypothetical protein
LFLRETSDHTIPGAFAGSHALQDYTLAFIVAAIQDETYLRGVAGKDYACFEPGTY